MTVATDTKVELLDHPAPASGDLGRADLLWSSPLRFFGFISALLTLVFAHVLLGNQTFFYRDYGVLGYPFVFYHRECFWRGEWPLWNPLSNCGAPFLAQWGTMTLYPFSLIYLILPLPWSLPLFSLLHLAWGATGIYQLARRWTQNPLAAALAGTLFVFSGLMFSCLTWPNYVVGLGWMPWVVLWVERAWREGGRMVVLGALAAAMQLLSGVPEIVLLTWLGIGCLALSDVWCSKEGRPRIVLRLGCVVLLASGLAAVQLLPFFDLLSHSQRDRSFATGKWSMPGWGWASLLVPLFHCFETPQGTFFQDGQEFMASYYLGILPLVLAGLAAFTLPHHRARILAGLVLFSLILALGDQGKVYTWVRTAVPVLGIGRYAVKFMILCSLTVPLLAAFGLAQLQTTQQRSPRRVTNLLVAGAAIVLVTIGVILWIGRVDPLPYDQWDVTARNALVRAGFFLGACCLLWSLLQPASAQKLAVLRVAWLALLALDAVTHFPKQLPTLPREILSPNLWAQHQSLTPPQPGHARAMITPEAEKHLLRSSVPQHLNDFIGKRLALWSNLNLLDGIPKVNGSSTLQLRHQKEVQDLIYKDDARPRPGEGLMDFLAVSHVTASNSVVDWAPRPTALPWITAGQNPTFLDGPSTLQRLATQEFDPRREVLLEPEAQAGLRQVQGGPCQVRLLNFSPNHLSFQVDSDQPRIVVLAQSFYHPWKATVSGQPTRLWRANHAFQALLVPAGSHAVALHYRDHRFQIGWILLATALAACAWIWFRSGARPSSAP